MIGSRKRKGERLMWSIRAGLREFSGGGGSGGVPGERSVGGGANAVDTEGGELEVSIGGTVSGGVGVDDTATSVAEGGGDDSAGGVGAEIGDGSREFSTIGGWGADGSCWSSVVFGAGAVGSGDVVGWFWLVGEGGVSGMVLSVCGY